MTKFAIQFRLPSGAVREATGREAETIAALVDAGQRGITSLEAFRAGWAVRLAAYIHDLKTMGVPIRTTRERHAGGSHGRYTLGCQIEIMWRNDGSAAA